MTQRFDTKAADNLVQQLGSGITSDPFYLSERWEQLSLVINLDGRKQMFGYIYSAGDWEAAGPDGIEPLETAAKLRDAMQLQGKAPWKKCLITIDRASTDIHIDFDYEGTKWVSDVADPAGFALALKPANRG
ncbi:hypothetical protein [Sphingomonas xinjiangensis]|uniref:Uncharacterized protein n=1 Tax=Sphingomonas xinjiangensis TaxID=643568 RepID=A0A840YTI9_9SPHN|nr:hypothetical protein [Sphingomonas xinjiangensis]MBB5712990.1 hypothetical protein [Sphingomonas xinjiangensis]